MKDAPGHELLYAGCMTGFLNFATFRRPPKPNNWLVLPEGFESVETPDAVSPRIAGAPDQVFAQLVELAEGRKDWRIVETDEDGRRIRLIAVTRLLRFKDDIDIAVMPAAGAPGESELAIYSRSRIGYSDLGTNAKRVKGILEAVVLP